MQTFKKDIKIPNPRLLSMDLSHNPIN